MGRFSLTTDYKLDLSDLTRTVVSVAADFTFLDLMRLVFEAQQRWPGAAAVLGMKDIDAFYAEATGERDDDVDDLRFLELYWAFDYDMEDVPPRRNRKGKRRVPAVRETPDLGMMSNMMSFHGVGEHWDDIMCTDDDCQLGHHHRQYGIWPASLNNLAHLPIRMDTSARVHPPNQMLRMRQFLHRFGRIGSSLLERLDKRIATPIITIEIEPTLHIFLSSVLRELTFGGSHPDKRKAECERIKSKRPDSELTDVDDMLDAEE